MERLVVPYSIKMLSIRFLNSMEQNLLTRLTTISLYNLEPRKQFVRGLRKLMAEYSCAMVSVMASPHVQFLQGHSKYMNWWMVS